MKTYLSPRRLIQESYKPFINGSAIPVPIQRWQGLDSDINLLEHLGFSAKCVMPETQENLLDTTDADMPWAENHFLERVGGKPTNPGDTFKDWPYYREDKYREGGIFTHTYQERYWPKYANQEFHLDDPDSPNKGVRFDYGDLSDVIHLLFRDPLTRQAYLPIWFPEDTGVNHEGRVPCSLGYLFNYRRGYLHLTYYIRSCDAVRHLKNDVYMTIRLAQYVLMMLRNHTDLGHQVKINWHEVKLGFLTMHVESLHIFESDTIEIKKRWKSLESLAV